MYATENDLAHSLLVYAKFLWVLCSAPVTSWKWEIIHFQNLAMGLKVSKLLTVFHVTVYQPYKKNNGQSSSWNSVMLRLNSAILMMFIVFIFRYLLPKARGNTFQSSLCSNKVYFVTPDILNSGALFLFLDKDKTVLRFCKRVIGKFSFQNKEWRTKKFTQRRQRFAWGPVTSDNNFKPSKTNTFKNEQNSQYFEIKLGTQNFLHNIGQSLA